VALNPRVWYPIAALGAALNVVAVAFAVSPGEPWHATIHAILAVGFGVWAQQLRAREHAAALGGTSDAEIAALRDEVAAFRGELNELYERMDFVERVLRRPEEPPARSSLPSDRS